MRKTPDPSERVLAIDPTNRGFGFAVFEGPQRLIDWGLAHSRQATVPRCLARIAGMIRIYEPATLVVEDCTSSHSHRGRRASELLQRAIRLATSSRLRICVLTWPIVKQAFAASRPLTKHHLACLLASRFDELAERLPPRRKPWMSEDERYGIFDATALGVAYLAGLGTLHRHRRPSNQRPTPGSSPEN